MFTETLKIALATRFNASNAQSARFAYCRKHQGTCQVLAVENDLFVLTVNGGHTYLRVTH